MMVNRGPRIALAVLSLGLSAQLLDAAHQLLVIEWAGDVARYVGVLGVAAALLVPVFGALGWSRAKSLHDSLVAAFTTRLEGPVAARPILWNVLFAASALFLEMSIIRWTSHRWLASYRNLALLGCFLGLGLGFLTGRRRPTFVPYLLPIIGLQYLQFRLLIEAAQPGRMPHLLPEAVGRLFISPQWQFLLIVIATLAPGQLVGALLSRRSDLGGYGANLAGSVLGVVSAYLMASLWTPPSTWLALLALLFLWAFPGGASVLGALLLAACMQLSALAAPTEELVIHSPYQRLGLRGRGFGHALGDGRVAITANSVYYQSFPAIETRRVRPELDVRHRIPDADLGPVRSQLRGAKVLALGVGAGTNVAQLLEAGVASVVAVDIDPAIVHLGRKLNADRPYDDPRVELVVDDARAYLRRTREAFDLVVFFWIDSLPGSSSSAGLRLDSLVYTRECFEQCKARLAPGGKALIYAWMPPAARLKILRTLENVFPGPVHTYRIGPWDHQWLFAIGDGFDSDPGPHAVPTALPDASTARLLTDDRPFLYADDGSQAGRKIAKFIGFLLAISLVGAGLSGVGRARSVAHLRGLAAFFLFGVAFMLVETILIMQIALLFGNTWQVSGKAVLAILLMAFAGNLVVQRGWAPRRIPLHAAGLVLTLMLVWRFRAGDVLGAFANPGLASLVYVVMASLPVFFSSVLFSILLDGFPAADEALGSNLLGAMLGGCIEYGAIEVGYRTLTLAIPVLYLVALGLWRGAPATARPPAVHGG